MTRQAFVMNCASAGARARQAETGISVQATTVPYPRRHRPTSRKSDRRTAFMRRLADRDRTNSSALDETCLRGVSHDHTPNHFAAADPAWRGRRLLWI